MFVWMWVGLILMITVYQIQQLCDTCLINNLYIYKYLTCGMINQELARTLSFPNHWQHYYLQSVAFYNNAPIWNKGKYSIFSANGYHKFQFYKVGKTFGMEVNRYIEYENGFLYYYEGQNDKQSKGFCVMENLYMYYFQTGDRYVMHLTNGTDFSSFHFSSNEFMKTYQNKIHKDVVQLNLKQKFQVGEQIGEGTFSKVYSAINKFTSSKVALKIVPKINSVQEFHTRTIVMQEKRILKRLNSELTCKMFQFYEDNDNYIFVLQYLEGKDLHIYLKDHKQIPLSQIVFILKQALKSLVLIHGLNIIHRDLKPHNIIYNPKARTVKLIDFGLSLIFDSHTELGKFMRCGTMGYIAPEIANNAEINRKKYDCKSDLFGFGIVAHMLLMGYNPVRGRTYKETVDRNLACDLNIDTKSISEKYGQNCVHFLTSLLQKDPNSRPTAQQALNNKFLNQKHSQQIKVKSELQDSKLVQIHKNDQINYIQDKQFGNSSKYQSKEELSPLKPPSAFRSKTKSFGIF